MSIIRLSYGGLGGKKKSLFRLSYFLIKLDGWGSCIWNSVEKFTIESWNDSKLITASSVFSYAPQRVGVFLSYRLPDTVCSSLGFLICTFGSVLAQIHMLMCILRLVHAWDRQFPAFIKVERESFSYSVRTSMDKKDWGIGLKSDATKIEDNCYIILLKLTCYTISISLFITLRLI